MTFDLQKILESKRALRHDLAARPVAEKLRLLDTLPQRQLAHRGRAVLSYTGALRKEPAPYLSSATLALAKTSPHLDTWTEIGG